MNQDISRIVSDVWDKECRRHGGVEVNDSEHCGLTGNELFLPAHGCLPASRLPHCSYLHIGTMESR